MEKSGFFGCDAASKLVRETIYSGIRTPKDLYNALKKCWCAETCAPRMRSDWNEDDATLGQCSVTSFLVQDLFGGMVFGIPLGDGNYHCFNVVGDTVFDLTSEQFRLGLKNIVELTQDKTNLSTAIQQMLRAKYEALLNMALLKYYNGEPVNF